MSSIPYVKSLGIHVLLAIAFVITEFPLPGNNMTANETCVNVSGQIICYFKGSEEIVDWNTAKKLCSSLNSTLPVMRNRNDQDAVTDYLKSHLNNFTAWTAGKNFTYSNWTWINGEPMKEFVKVQFQEDEAGLEKVNAAIDADFTFTAQAASYELPYICQYQGAFCNTSIDISVAGKCLRLVSNNRTWYDARNRCLMSNGDLAVIGADAHSLLKKLTLNQSYWIGLNKQSWRWTLNDNAESTDEIKYTNWDSHVFSTHSGCISIHAFDGKWKTFGCIQQMGVVCQRAVSKESTTEGSQSSIPQSLLFAAVGAGIVIIICIIVIIVFARRTKKGGNRQSRPTESSPQYKREEFDARITNTPVYASVNESANAPVTTSEDIRGVYAEIPMSTANQSEDGATDQQPGIVYASLEFKDDPTYLESDKTNANATAPNKVCPLGDIYAMPDAKGHAVTTPGNESASQQVKVTPQGEVVYANLQAEMLDKEQASKEEDHTK